VRQLALRHELDVAHREAARLREISTELARKNRALEAQADQLDRLAREDPLTGLGNRRALEQWFIRWSLDPAHGERPIALALLDIDHFKAINDRFSHSVGDSVLQAAADILRRHHRGSDVVVRYGGEEFVLVLPGTELESAHAMCERLRVAIESHEWSRLREGLAVTASIGIAAGRAGESLESLFQAADARLYQAKEAGRNQVRPRPDHVR
jgi:diguanylate cyclase (GGDEF)-like protein